MKKTRIIAILLAVMLVFTAVACEEEPAVHNHVYGKEWKYDATNHWHECECGDKADVAEHTFEVIKDGEGLVKKCTVCNYKAEEKIENATLVATVAELKAAVAGDKIIYLAGDIELNDEGVTIGKSIVIDGNGKTVSYSGEAEIAAFSIVGDKYDVQFKNITIDSTQGAIWDFGTNGSIKIDDSTISGTEYFALYHNGLYEGFKCTATNSSFISGDTVQGIYISGSLKTSQKAGRNQQLVFKNCRVVGSTGIEGKYTDMILDNCEVEALAETPAFEQYNNGSTTDGFAVVSTDNSMKPDSPKPIATITISGGTYKGLVGLKSLVDIEKYPDFTEATFVFINEPKFI